eukprot:3707872-Pleurochrysis_carterae.AAC.1
MPRAIPSTENELPSSRADVGAGGTPSSTERTEEELLRNEFYLVMLDQTKIGDLKGEVSKDLYPNVPNYGELPD